VHSRKWKEFEKTIVFRKAKLLAKRLTGKEPWLSVETAINLQRYADWILCRDLTAGCSVVYSLGVGDNIDFDLAVVKELGAQVHAFDPTPKTSQWLSDKELPKEFHFYPWAVAGRDGELVLYPRLKRDGTLSSTMFTLIAGDESVRDHAVRVPALTLQTIMARLGHHTIDILKMDIEGAEYDVLESMLATAIRPVQLLVEFHSGFPGIGRDKTIKSVRQLKSAGYTIADISVTGREVLFVKMDCLENNLTS